MTDTAPLAKTSLVPRRRFWLVRLLAVWLRGIQHDFFKPKGWQLIATFFGGVTLVWGFLSGLMTFHLDHLEKLSDYAERSYYEVVSDLASSNARVRVGALHRMPEVMLRPVPDVKHFSLLDALKLTVGSRPRGVHPYHSDLRTMLHSYFVGLALDNVTPSTPEVSAFVNLLIELGPEGWYYEAPRPSIQRTKGLKWIWSSAEYGSHGEENPSDLFVNTTFKGLDLQDFHLEHADFYQATLANANLRGSFLDNSRLSRTDLSGAKLTGAHLNFADMISANLSDADLEGADFGFARFKTDDRNEAQVSRAFAARTDFSQCDCLGLRLTSAILIQSKFLHTNFQSATFDKAMLNGALLQGADLSFVQADDADFSETVIANSNFREASLRRAVFSGADIQRTIFRGADLRGANFSNYKTLDLTGDFRNANIAGARGLGRRTLEELRRRGAVSIQSDAAWAAFRDRVPWLKATSTF